MGKNFNMADFLNRRTQSQITSEKIEMIDVHLIDPNPNNKYTMKELKYLGNLIKRQNGIIEHKYNKKK